MIVHKWKDNNVWVINILLIVQRFEALNASAVMAIQQAAVELQTHCTADLQMLVSIVYSVSSDVKSLTILLAYRLIAMTKQNIFKWKGIKIMYMYSIFSDRKFCEFDV